VLVRLGSDRCCYADPPPRPPGSTGRPRRHGAKSAFATPAVAAAGPARSCAAPSCACRSSGSRPAPAHPRCCGGGGPGPAHWTRPGGPTSVGSTRSTPSAAVGRPSAGPPRGLARPPGRPLDLAGPGRLHPAPPGPRDHRRPAAAAGAAPTPATAVTAGSAARVSAAAVRAGLAGGCAETLRALPRPTQGCCSGPATRYPAINKPATTPRKKPTKTTKAT
jgi:hypothetical protein